MKSSLKVLYIVICGFIPVFMFCSMSFADDDRGHDGRRRVEPRRIEEKDRHKDRKTIRQRETGPHRTVIHKDGPHKTVIRKDGPHKTIIHKDSRPRKTVIRKHTGPRKTVIHRPYPRGKTVVHLPSGYHVVKNRKDHYYHSGRFYRKIDVGFRIVAPPIGAFILSLPLGYTRIAIGGTPHYYYDGVYYRKEPEGFCVVRGPEIIEEEEIHTVVEPGGQRMVKAALLNVRSGPGGDFEILFQVEKGTLLYVEGESKRWYYVKIGDEEYGWVMKKFTEPVRSSG